MTDRSDRPVQSLQFKFEPPILETTRVGEDPALAFVKLLAELLDSRFQIPGTKVRFGYDAMLGVVPVVGDLIGLFIGSFIVAVAAQKGVSKPVITRMMLNLGIDAIVSAIPLVGDLFDVAWKANQRNATLLQKALAEPERTLRSSWWLIAGLIGLLLICVAGAGAFSFWLITRIMG